MPSGGLVTVSQAKAEPISPAGMTHPLPNATPPLLLPPNSPGAAFTSTAVYGSNPNLLAQESQLLVSLPFDLPLLALH